jgi:twinkle protein
MKIKELIYEATDFGKDVFRFYTERHFGQEFPEKEKKMFRLRAKDADKTPSTNVCFVSGAYVIRDFGDSSYGIGLNCIDWIAMEFNLSFHDACSKICEDMNLQVDKGEEQQAYELPKRQNLTQLDDLTLAWFESRGISQHVVRMLNIEMQANKFMAMAKKEIKVISFPFYRKGFVVNYKHRGYFKNSEGKVKRAFQQEKNSIDTWYGIDEVKPDTKRIVIVEGETDKASVMEAFKLEDEMPVCLSVPNGVNSLGKIPAEDWDAISHAEAYIIFVDEDVMGQGQKLREELLRRLRPAKCMDVERPKGCKDANDVLKTHGPEKLREVVDNAFYLDLEGHFTLNGDIEELDDYIENGEEKGVEIGIFPNLSRMHKFARPRLNIWTGVPEHGKTTMLLNVINELYEEQKWKTALWSPEHARRVYFWGEAIEVFSGYCLKHSKAAKENPEAILPKEIYSIVKGAINDRFSMVKTPKYDIDSILTTFEGAVYRHGVKSIVIDPFNRIDLPNNDKKKGINDVLSKLNEFKNEFWVSINLVVHPRKMEESLRIATGEMDDAGKPVTINAFQVPGVYDLDGASDFANQADNIFVVYRNIATNITKLIKKKQKYKNDGYKGEVDFTFDPINSRMSEVSSVTSRQRLWAEGLPKVEIDFNNINMPPDYPEDDIPF